MRRSKMSKMSMARNRTKIQKKKIDKMENGYELEVIVMVGVCILALGRMMYLVFKKRGV